MMNQLSVQLEQLVLLQSLLRPAMEPQLLQPQLPPQAQPLLGYRFPLQVRDIRRHYQGQLHASSAAIVSLAIISGGEIMISLALR